MQNRFGLLDTDVMPICIIIALDIVITLHFSISFSSVICSPAILFSFKGEASSETYGARVYFPSYIFRPIKPKPKVTLLQFIYLHFVLRFSNILYLSLSDLTIAIDREGIDYLCRCIDWRLACASYWIDTLVL